MMDRSSTKAARVDEPAVDEPAVVIATRAETNVDWRRFIARAASTVAGLTGASVAMRSGAQDMCHLALQRMPGEQLGGNGARSSHVKLARVCGGGPDQAELACDIYSNNSKTPIQSLYGTATPSDLHFERSHSGTPFLDPKVHRSLVHGLSAKPTVFTMDDLYKMPSVTRMAFIECAGNGWNNWKEAKPKLTAQNTHGLISTSEWTGVPLPFILNQVGSPKDATWRLAEGADGAGVDRSIPLNEAVLRDGVMACWPLRRTASRCGRPTTTHCGSCARGLRGI